MTLIKRIFQKSGKRRGATFKPAATVVTLATIALALAAALVAGCGDSGSDTTAQKTSPNPGAAGVSRPAPGTVELLDSKSDISATQSLAQAPSWLDINWASIAGEGGNLKFSIDVAGALPETMPVGAADLGFLLDTNKDGKPDWGVHASISKAGWSPDIYNQETKQRLAGAQFPGTITHTGTTLVLSIPAAAVGSPAGFKWFVYTDSALPSDSSNEVGKAGDFIGDERTSPGDSTMWPEYP